MDVSFKTQTDVRSGSSASNHLFFTIDLLLSCCLHLGRVSADQQCKTVLDALITMSTLEGKNHEDD